MEPTPSQPQRKFAHRHAAILLTISAGLLITATVFAQIAALERRSLKQTFLRQVDQHMNTWTSMIQDRLSVIDSVCALYASSDVVNRDEFHIFVERSALRYSGVKAVLWVPRVPTETRCQHEQQARRDGIERYHIADAMSDLDSPTERLTYFPIYYIEPLMDNSQALGLDLGSDPSWRDILDQAAVTGQMTAAAQMHLPGYETDVELLPVIQAIYRHDRLILTGADRQANLQGFIIGILNLGMIAESASASLASEKIDIELLDMTQGEPRYLYPRTADALSLSQSDHAARRHRNALAFETPLGIAGERLMIRCVAAPGYGGTGSSLLSLASLAVGLGVTCLVTLYVRDYHARYERIQRLVAEKTRELNRSNADLEQRNSFLRHILASMTHPLYVIDAKNLTIKLSNQVPLSADGNTGPKCHEIIHGRSSPCNGSDWPCTVNTVKDSCRPCVIERVQRDRQGALRTIEVHGYPVLDDSGEVSEVIEYHLDITERKQIEQIQREHAEELAAIYNNAPLVMMLVDSEKRIRKVNRFAVEFAGRPENDILGHCGGDALGCLNSLDDPGGCGFGPACADCIVRRTVTDTLETGENHVQVEARLPFSIDGDRQELAVLLSTARLRLQDEWMVLVSILNITDRKRAEQQVAEQLAFTKTLLDTIPTPVYYKDCQGRYLGANKAFAEFVGCPESDIVGKTAFDIAPADLAEKYHRQDLELFSHPGVQHYEWQVRNAAGEAREVMFDKATFTVDGTVRGLVGVVSDITERKAVEDELRTQKDLLSHVLANIPAFVFWKDRGCVYLGCNDNFARSAGVDRSENIVGKTDCDLVWRDDAEAYQQDDKRVMESGEPLLAFEETQTTAEGGQITLLTSKVPLRDPSGAVVGVLGIYTDITERKQAQEEIADLARFTEENPCPVLRVKNDGTILYANRASRPLLEVFETEIGDSLPPEWGRSIEAIFNAREVTRTEFGCEHKTYSITLAPVPDRGYVNLYALDISGRKVAEQRQAELLGQMKAINRELEDFAYVTSHDLKAPLRGIRTLADWLLADTDNRLSEESQEHLELLVGRVDRMHNLINGILEYSRVSRSNEKHNKVDLNNCVAGIIDSLAPPEHISIVADNGLPVVWGEATRLTQLFQNLISNAIKYMDKEEGRIEIGCDRDEDHWRFSVSDNGPGIPSQYFERIFQLFQTLAPKDETESTGVGLAVAKKIVESHGGEIWVKSKSGEGATFFFTLPMVKTEEGDGICKTPATAAC